MRELGPYMFSVNAPISSISMFYLLRVHFFILCLLVGSNSYSKPTTVVLSHGIQKDLRTKELCLASMERKESKPGRITYDEGHDRYTVCDAIIKNNPHGYIKATADGSKNKCGDALARAKKEAIDWAQKNCRTGAAKAAYGLEVGNVKHIDGCSKDSKRVTDHRYYVRQEYKSHRSSKIDVRCGGGQGFKWKDGHIDITTELQNKFRAEGWGRKVESKEASGTHYTHHVSCDPKEKEQCLKKHKDILFSLGCPPKAKILEPEFGEPVFLQNYALQTECQLSSTSEGLLCDSGEKASEVRNGWSFCQGAKPGLSKESAPQQTTK